LGMERVILALKKNQRLTLPENPLDIFLIALGERAEYVGFLLMEDLRKRGIYMDMDYTDKSLKAKMRRADKIGARFVLIIGEDEVEKGEYILRDMSSGEQLSIKKENVVEELVKKLHNNHAV
ncbi:MAG: His/Gly/Thr/Pro-type tRNA ligase C-terminal domain-containing protein, partial [Candidatus Omnitrophota bacterium]